MGGAYSLGEDGCRCMPRDDAGGGDVMVGCLCAGKLAMSMEDEGNIF